MAEGGQLGSWTDFPAITGTDIQLWDWFIQIPRAIAQRQAVLGANTLEWPGGNVVWTSGTVSDLTDNGDGTLTATFNDVDWTTHSPCSSDRWVGYECSPGGHTICYIPANYDLIIEGDPDDPYTVVRAEITAQTYSSGTGTLTFSDLNFKNSITAHFIPSLADLIGKHYDIIKHGGLHYTDRLPTKPNGREEWRGTVASGNYLDSTGNGYISQLFSDYNPSPYDTTAANIALYGEPNPPVAWKPDQWKGMDALFFDGAGKLWRKTISGNSQPRIVIGSAVWNLTTTGTGGTYTLSAASGTTTALAFNANAATIQSALEAIPGVGTGKATVTGSFVVTFASSLGAVILAADGTLLTGGTVTVADPSGDLTPSGAYLVVKTDANHSGKAMPGRDSDYIFQFYQGIPESAYTHDPTNDGVTTRPIMAPDGSQATYWLEGDPDAGFPCEEVGHKSVDVDAQIEIDNACECARAGDFLRPKYWTTIRSWQAWILQNCASFVVPQYSGSVALPYDGSAAIPTWTIPTLMTAVSGNAAGFTRYVPREARYPFYPKIGWIPDCSLAGGCVDPPRVTAGGEMPTPDNVVLALTAAGGTLNYNTAYYYRVSAVNASGETLASAEQSISTVLVDNTVAPAVPFTANTYTVQISWDQVVGATSYNVYGRTSGGELLLGSTTDPATSFVDDGSVTPAGALPSSNTTHNDCYGAGQWIFRGLSTNYKVRDSFGVATDSATPFQDGDLVRYTGDDHSDPNAGRGLFVVGGSTPPDNDYWNRLVRSKPTCTVQQARETSRAISVTAGTKYSIQDASKAWWTDGINTGQLRVQGGTANGGSATTLTIAAPTGDGACWWATSRFSGDNPLTASAVAPYETFLLEIYKGGLPTGWSVAADGTATYTAPTPSHGGSITGGSPPTISSVPNAPVANGLPVTFFVYGDNIQSTVTATLINIDTADTQDGTIVSQAAGYAVVTGNFGLGSHNWTVTLTNAGTLDSLPFAFTTQQFYKLPILSSGIASGILTVTMAGADGLTVANGDGFLIREPSYELNKWQKRYCKISVTGSPDLILPLTHSDNDSIFFAAQSAAIPVGASATIIEYTVGEVWRFATATPSGVEGVDYTKTGASSFWIIPTGDDVVRLGVRTPRPFRADRTCNLPTITTEYGLFNVGDYVDGLNLHNELYTALNLLVWTLKSPDWAVKTFWAGGGSSYRDNISVVDDGSGGPVPPETTSSVLDSNTFVSASGVFSGISPVSTTSNMGTYSFATNSRIGGGLGSNDTGGYTITELDSLSVSGSGGEWNTGTFSDIKTDVENHFNTPPTDWRDANGPYASFGGEPRSRLYEVGIGHIPEAHAGSHLVSPAWDGSAWQIGVVFASLEAKQSRLKVEVDITIFNYQIDWYAKATANGVWDDYSTGLIEDKWHNFDSEDGTAAQPQWSTMLGWGTPEFPSTFAVPNFNVTFTIISQTNSGGVATYTIHTSTSGAVDWAFSNGQFGGSTSEVDLGGGVIEYLVDVFAGSLVDDGVTTATCIGNIVYNTGYTVTDKAAVLRWDVPGGFTYIAP